MLFVGCGGGGGDEPQPQPQPTPQPTPTPPSDPVKLPLSVSAQMAESSDAFNDGARIGLFVVSYKNGVAGNLATSGNYMDNVEFKLSSGAWSAQQQYYWPDESTKADLYFYYPYTTSVGNVTEFCFDLATDQSEADNYNSCKFYWGKKAGISPSSQTVSLSLNQLMSGIKVTLIAGDGYSNADLANAGVEIRGLKSGASVNLSTGKVQSVGDVTTIFPYGVNDERLAIVVPQSITDTEMIVVTIDGNEYSLIQTVTLEPGKSHSCEVTIKKDSQGLNFSVSGWDISDEDFGGTV